jgi:phage shock protein A
MSILRRMSDVVQQRLNHVLDSAEDPNEALDLSYEKQLAALQQVRRNVADVLTSEKRLELQAAQLEQSQAKLQAQAQTALQQGREDLATVALTRAETIRSQLGGMKDQIEQLKAQEQKLEVMAQKLQAKVEAFRTQKETMKAQYSAAQASTQMGEAVTGLSEQMADASMMVDRAQEKTERMQARAAAMNQLVDTGALDQIGSGPTADLDRQLEATTVDTNVQAQLAAMKQQLALPESTTIVRIQGEDQYRISQADKTQLEAFDAEVVAAVNASDQEAFQASVKKALDFVRARGAVVPHEQILKSDMILPPEDMTLDEAKKILAGEGAPATPS